MVRRLEFSSKVKIEIYKRAGGPDDVHCEGCGWKIRGRNFEIDHAVAEWILENIERGLRGPLTAADGKLLGNGKECGCHKQKTAREAGARAHGNRIVAKAAKANRKSRRPIYNIHMKKKLDGSVVDRRTGRPWGERTDDVDG